MIKLDAGRCFEPAPGLSRWGSHFLGAVVDVRAGDQCRGRGQLDCPRSIRQTMRYVPCRALWQPASSNTGLLTL